jgi:hypothetical protein
VITIVVRLARQVMTVDDACDAMDAAVGGFSESAEWR